MIFKNEFYIKQIEKLAYHRSYYKILGKYHVADVRHRAFESTPGDISTWYDYAERFGFDPDGHYRMNSLTTIVPYQWKVSV